MIGDSLILHRGDWCYCICSWCFLQKYYHTNYSSRQVCLVKKKMLIIDITLVKVAFFLAEVDKVDGLTGDNVNMS